MSQVADWAKDARTVIFPNTVRELRSEAFRGNGLLRAVVLNEGLEKLSAGNERESIFKDTGLEKVRVLTRMRVLDDRVFSGCKSLRRVELPDGLEQVGVGSFRGTGLEEFTVPPGLRVIDGLAFSDCTSLKRVTLNEGLRVLGSSCTYDTGVFHGSQIGEITLPRTL